jgi:hypothetical protein
MELLINSMPEMNPANPQTPGADYNLQDKSSPDKSEFASLVEKECSKSTDCKSDRKDIHSESAMKEDAGSNSDRPACSECKTGINDTRHSDMGNNDRQKAGGIEPVNREVEHKDDEVDSGKGLKTGALLFSIVQSYIAEIANTSQASTDDGTTEAADIGAGEPGSESALENGLKVGTLLNNIITNYAAETGEGFGPEPESDQTMVLSGAESSALSAGNGLKVGTLLNNLITNYVEEIEGGVNFHPQSDQTMALSGNESPDLPAGNGLKVGTLLNNLASGPAADIEVVSVPNSESNQGAKLEGNESVETGPESHGENGLKIGELLNRLTDRSDEKQINKNLIKEEVASAEKTIDINTKADDSEADSLIFRKEIPALAEIKNEISRPMEKIHPEDNVVDAAMPEDSDNSGKLNSRPMSGSSDQFKQENGTGDHAFNFAKALHNSGNDAETNNINSINTSNTAIENARSVQSPSALHTAKAAGVQELLDNVIYVIKGNSRMGVSVEHENLGKLNINLSLEKGMVNVHINTSDQAVREIIENNIQHIIDSLNKDGVSVGEFSVGLRDQREHEINRSALKNGQDTEIPKEIKKEHLHRGLINIFA